MNGKQAKRLRRAALWFATTLDEAGRTISERRKVTIDSRIENAPDSFRGIYRSFKKGERNSVGKSYAELEAAETEAAIAATKRDPKVLEKKYKGVK